MKKFIVIEWGLVSWLNRVAEDFKLYTQEVQLAVIARQDSNLECLIKGDLSQHLFVVTPEHSRVAFQKKADALLDRNNNLLLDEKKFPLGYGFSPNSLMLKNLVESAVSGKTEGFILDQASDSLILQAGAAVEACLVRDRLVKTLKSGN